MKKKIICLLLILLIICTGCSFKTIKNKIENKLDSIDDISLMKFSKFNRINVDNVKSIDYIRLTEAGRDENNITDASEIQRIYNSLSNKKVGKVTNKACDDNTTIYNFNMNDGEKISIEIECEWLVIGNTRYELK